MKKTFKIVLVCLFIISAFLFTACTVKERYNAVGTAQINLTLDNDYGDVSVTCSGATITNDGLKYTISLGLIAHTDVIVSSYGYQPKIIHFTTTELAQSVIDKTISLTAKQKTLVLSIDKYSHSQLEGVQVLANDDELDFVIEKNSLKILLEDENRFLKIQKQGCFPYSIDLEDVTFKNFSASVKIPFIETGSSKVSISITADNPLVKNSLPYSLTKYENTDYKFIDRNYIEKTNLITLNTNTNYNLTIDWDNNTFFSSILLTQLYENGDVYQSYKLSELYTKKHESTYYKYSVEKHGDVDMYQAIFYNQNGELLHEILYQTSVNASDVTVLLQDNNGQIISLYNCDVKSTGKIILEANKFDDNFERTITFVDMHENPREDISAKLIYNADTNPEFLDFLSEVDGVYYDDANGSITYDLLEILKEYGAHIFVEFSFNNINNVTFAISELIKGSKAIIDDGVDIAIEFFYENMSVEASQVIEYLYEYSSFEIKGGLLRTKPEYKVKENNAIPLDMVAKYKSLSKGSDSYIIFSRNMFYYDEDLSAYKFDFHLTEGTPIEIEINIVEKGIFTPIREWEEEIHIEIFVLDEYKQHFNISNRNLEEETKFYANVKHIDFAIRVSLYGAFKAETTTVTVKQEHLDAGVIEINLKAPVMYEIEKY